jgi:hypothetical protein
MPLSQGHPPKKCADTWQLGTATATRSSKGESRKVCVAPPELPVMPMRLGSTPSMLETKSRARMQFHVIRRWISGTLPWSQPAFFESP